MNIDTRALVVSMDEADDEIAISQEDKQRALDIIGIFQQMDDTAIRLCVGSIILQQLCIDSIENPTKKFIDREGAVPRKFKSEDEIFHCLVSFLIGPYRESCKLISEAHMRVGKKEETKQ